MAEVSNLTRPGLSPSGSPAIHPRGAPPFTINPIKRTDRYIKELIYGKHGVGKTTLAASSADVDIMADVLMIDCESGDLSISDNDRIQHRDRIMTVKVSDFMTIGKVYEFMSSHCHFRDSPSTDSEAKLKDIQSWLTGVPLDKIDHIYRFRTVIIDSLSEAEQYNMTSLMGYTESELMGGQSTDEVEVMGWGEFRKNKLMIEYLIRRFRNLPCHLIAVCAEGYLEDEVKRKAYRPALTGQLSRTIQGPFDVVGHLSIGDKNQDGTQPRLFRVKPDKGIDAKCRFAQFTGDGFQDPSQSKIMAAVGLLGTSGTK